MGFTREAVALFCCFRYDFIGGAQMKYVVLLMILLSLFTPLTAQADNEHIETQLSPQIKLNVDICPEDIKWTVPC